MPPAPKRNLGPTHIHTHRPRFAEEIQAIAAALDLDSDFDSPRTGGPLQSTERESSHKELEVPYPFTLIFENDSTARLGVGRPIDNAGRNVVKISIRFTCGSTSFDTLGSERIW